MVHDQYLRRARDGDADAFAALVQHHRDAVVRTARAVLRDRARLDDVVQETFLQAWQGLQGLREPGRLRPWLTAIARHLAARSLRDKH